MNLCPCDSDERERGVGAGVTPTNAFFLQFICSRMKRGEGRGFVYHETIKRELKVKPMKVKSVTLNRAAFF